MVEEMSRLLTGLALLVALLLPGQNVAARGDDPQPSIILEARLISHSSYISQKCGGDFLFQVAKYRVLKVLAGSYTGREIIVDHPACDGDVFKRIPVGSRVRLSLSVRRELFTITNYPGIRMVKGRDDIRHIKLFYVAWAPPKKL
jgi:hypothetical protein